MPAGVAGIDPHVTVCRRLEVPELPLVFLAAVHAQHAAERPDGQARGTEQRAAAAVERATRRLQNRYLRHPSAERAAVVGASQPAIDWCNAGLSQPLCVRLQHGFGEKLSIRRNMPTRQKEIVDGHLRTLDQLPGIDSERLRTILRNRLQ